MPPVCFITYEKAGEAKKKACDGLVYLFKPTSNSVTMEDDVEAKENCWNLEELLLHVLLSARRICPQKTTSVAYTASGVQGWYHECR